MAADDKYLDVLQNLEFAIQIVYKAHSDLTDYEVQFALDSLIEFYTAEERNRQPRNFNLSENSKEVYEEVKKMCEFRLGRSIAEFELQEKLSKPITIEEILICLKKIKKSVTTWTKRNGRQGYLDFVKPFIR